MRIEEGTRQKLLDIRRKAVADLRDDVQPFWTRATWDHEHGGFLTGLDRAGNVMESSETGGLRGHTLCLVWALRLCPA
jgi:mannose/cellobiose epimerase-like protein (N-acyl-D-glucosamine 2-epimerase family)